MLRGNQNGEQGLQEGEFTSYSDIYSAFVSGPRRGRKGGSYGSTQESMRIKGSKEFFSNIGYCFFQYRLFSKE